MKKRYTIQVISRTHCRRSCKKEKQLENSVAQLRKEIDCGIKTFGIFNHLIYGKIYAYEVDGLGNYQCMG